MWKEEEKLLEACLELELEDKLLVEEESNDMRYEFWNKSYDFDDLLFTLD